MSRRAELAALNTTLQELSERVSALVEEASQVEDDRMYPGLLELERGLNQALRRLDRLSRDA